MEQVITEQHDGWVKLTLNRPEAKNALNTAVLARVAEALTAAAADPAVRAALICGADGTFAAGADIAEIEGKTSAEGAHDPRKAHWAAIRAFPKPLVAAVDGFALGGGCEFAMMCDMIIASDTAKFGQPEIRLGIMPGVGGTQRLTRAVGKAKAMEMCLTGRMMDAQEAERSGLVARIVPVADLLEDAMKTAATIASYSLTSVMLTKEAINRAFETTQAEGVRFERRAFQSMFATEDQKEGMAAFLEKRPAAFKNR